MKIATPSLASCTPSPPNLHSARSACARRLVRLAVAVGAAVLLAGFAFAPAAAAATGDFIITGRGNGQGQGMSQWGAWEGAREGNTYQQILAFYYPGTVMADLATVAPARQTVTVRITTSYDTFTHVQLTASVTGATLVDSTGATIQTLTAGQSVTLVNSGGKVQVSGGAGTTYTYVDLKPADDTGRVTVKPSDGLWSGGARQYWGYIRIWPDSSGKVYVHNIVSMEHYVAGVAEIVSSWAIASNTTYYAPDAVKTQAVAARTFIAVHSGAVPYDDSRDMNYVGYNYEASYPNVTVLAGQTAGQVLTYGGKLIATHFSGHSGGYTTNSAWSDGGSVAYEPAQADPWSAAAPPTNVGYAWTVSMSPSALASALRGSVSVGTITAVEVTQRDTADPASHARYLKITGSTGTATIAARSFASLLSLRSTLILGVVKDGSFNRYEQGDTNLAYTGTWTIGSSSSASGGSYRYAARAGASCTVDFTGKYIAWYGKVKSTYGIARVSLDGVDQGPVDLYSSTEGYKKLWESGTLTDGAHTLVITCTGTKNASSTNYNVAVDCFDIDGSITQATPPVTTTTYQDTNSGLLYAGPWFDQTATSASGGSFRYLDSAGSCTVKFTGTSVSWMGKKKNTYGKAAITLDGVDKGTVDLYSATELYKQTLWSSGTLSSGAHTLVVAYTGTKNASATDYNISVDAFTIAGTLTPICTRYQQDNAGLTYAGTWTTFAATGASGGSYKRANTSSASVTIKFTGSYLAWIATKGTTLGKASVSVDGGAAKTVDLSATTVAYQQLVWNTGLLSSGSHTVKISWSTSNAAGKYIGVDAIDLVGAFG